MSPRPRAFVVGEEALVRRRRRWGCAAALVVAEHAACLLMGLCLLWAVGLAAAGGSPSLPARWLCDERCDVQTLPPGLGARERCAPGAPCSCPGWAGSVRSGRHGPSGDVSRGFDDSCGRPPELDPEAPTCGVPTSIGPDSARAVALIERLPSRRSAHPGRRSATPIERTRRRARRQRRQPTARQRRPGPQKA